MKQKNQILVYSYNSVHQYIQKGYIENIFYFFLYALRNKLLYLFYEQENQICEDMLFIVYEKS